MSRTPELVCLGCVNIVDNERLNAYVKWAQDEGKFPPGCCPRHDHGFCDLDTPPFPYTNPIDDQACWYDPDVPESADFLGLWIVDLEGYENDPLIVGINDIGGDGTAFNRPIRPGKTLTFQAMLVATSGCGMDYGRSWLASVLRGQGCTHGADRFGDLCGTTELQIRECCPTEGMSDDGIRRFPLSKTTAGVTRIDGDRRDRCCDVYRMYTFTITTGTADAFGSPVQSCQQELDLDNSFCPPCFPTVVTPEPCADITGCGDLFIDAFASPSLREDCFCEPLEQTINCCCIDEFNSGSTERAIIIDLFAGTNTGNPTFTAQGARNIEVNIFENPQGLPCPTTQDDYFYFRNNVPICAQIRVGFIPSSSFVKIDGRTGQAYYVCAGIAKPIYDGVTGDLKKLTTGCNQLVVCSLWDRGNAVYPPASPGVIPSYMRVSTARKH